MGMTISAVTRPASTRTARSRRTARAINLTERSWSDPEVAWERFCGFLDLDPESYRRIQTELLNEQVRLVSQGRLGARLLRYSLPTSIEEFRQTVPLTTYGDYAEALDRENTENLPEGDYTWAHTTGAQANFKWVPYTRRAYDRLLDGVMTAFILSAAREKGDVRIGPGTTVMYNTPPRPYLSGLVTFGMRERFGLRGVIEPEVAEQMEFKSKIRKTFEQALKEQVDYIVSMTSVLVRAGETFEQDSHSSSQSSSSSSKSIRSLNARALGRIVKAKSKSAILQRPVRPKDLWPAKGIIGWGVDTAVFKDSVEEYWGKPPFEMYACTEGGVMGVQSYEHKGLVFTPYSGFYEFIPESENNRARNEAGYTLETVLLEETIPGETYEVVITNFYGQPFLRYRLGHFVRFLEPPPGGFAHGPEFEFLGRADDRIDIAGFTRVDEATLWQALRDSGLNLKDWTMTPEHVGDRPILSLYAEMDDTQNADDVASRIHNALKARDPFYKDLESMLGIQPLRASKLTGGTFERFYDEKRAQGRELHELLPPRMNPGDSVVADLMRLSSEGPKQ